MTDCEFIVSLSEPYNISGSTSVRFVDILSIGDNNQESCPGSLPGYAEMKYSVSFVSTTREESMGKNNGMTINNMTDQPPSPMNTTNNLEKGHKPMMDHNLAGQEKTTA